MMKKVGLMMAGMFLFTSVGCASPLADYSKGKAALDVTYRAYQDMDANVGLYGLGDRSLKVSDQFDGKRDFEWGMTLGLGDDWAVQYRGFNAQAKKTYPIFSDEDTDARDSDSRSLTIALNPKVRSQEFNVLRKLDKNFSVFAGLVRVTPSVKISGNYNSTGYYAPTATFSEVPESLNISGGLTLGGEDKNIGQIGIIGSTKLADKTNLYGIASIGKDYRNWETGISYEFAKDTEFNVSYRAANYDNLKIAGLNIANDQEAINAEVKSDVETKGWGFGVTYKF